MNFLKPNLLIIFASSLMIMGTITTSTAQERMIIGKRTTHAKTQRTQTISKKLPKKSNTLKLAHQITIGKNTDAEKARSIFNWIANTIEYDHELRLNQKLQKEIYISEANVISQALKRKKALCGGYAFLFKKLCADVGIKTEIIHGFTTQPNTYKNTQGKPEHTWNALYLNGEWHLLDITWAISHGTPNKPNWYWYKTNAAEFAKTHLPKDGKWQQINSKFTTR